MTQNKKPFQIVEGPGKWDLLTSFGSAPSSMVQFEYIDNNRRKIRTSAQITGLEYDGDISSWIFKGNAEMPSGWENIAGHYNTHHRKGDFKIVP